MPSAASINLLGHIGYKNEMKNYNNLNILDFSLAISRKERDDYVTDWYKVVVFGKQAEYLDNKLRKGLLVNVSGVPSISIYEDKQGVSRTTVTVRANSVVAITPKPASQDNDNSDVPF